VSGSRTIVVGAGLSGLVRARTLAAAGEDVLLLERGAEPGGVVRTVEQEGFLLELGPNTVRPTSRLMALAAELGLTGEMVFADPKLPRFIETGGRLRKIPFPALSPWALLRAAAEPFLPRRTASGEESAYDFVARRFGTGIARYALEPFVSGIYAGDAHLLSAEAAFPKIVAAEREHGSVVRGLLASRKKAAPAAPLPKGLLSFRRGLSALPRAIAAALGERFRAGVEVERIERAGAGWRVVAGKETLSADSVVLAGSAGAAARMVAGVAPEAFRVLAGMAAPSLCVAHCVWPADAFARPVSGFGHLLVPAAGEIVLGAVWTSALFPDRAPAGTILITYFLGGRRNPGAAASDDAAIAAAVDADARRALGARTPPRLVRTTRYDAAIPQYEVGHVARLETLAAAERALPGLELIGNYRGGISVGDVVDNAAGSRR
jgi:oxygen-dependent protoporphyrinogen oxidase